MPVGSIVRMPFKAAFKVFGGFRKTKDPLYQHAQVFGCKKSGSAAAQVQFPDLRPGGEQIPVELPFFQYCPDIGLFHLMPFGDALVATAESAHLLAER